VFGANAIVVGLVVTVAAVLITTATGDPHSGSAASSGAGVANAPVTKRDRAQDELLRQAASGDRKALAKLGGKPEKQRSLAEWKALGRGYAKTADLERSLTAYGRALRLDPSLGADARLQRDVRQALGHSATHREAIALCTKSLGSAGADLLYDVWESYRRDSRMKPYADRAMQALTTQAVRESASPALSIAMDLQQARGCAAHKKLLPRAAQHADARSDPYLRRLLARKGCGFLGLGDCYSCVRGDANLRPALDRARTTPAPDFSTAPEPPRTTRN
jgi:hypothetical protein